MGPLVYKACAIGKVILLFVAVFLGFNEYTGQMGLCFFVVLCPGAPKGSTGSGFGFKASQKMGQGF